MNDICTKVGYSTEKHAKEVVNRAHRKNQRSDTIPLRVYHCPICKQRHTTSQPLYLKKWEKRWKKSFISE